MNWPATIAFAITWLLLGVRMLESSWLARKDRQSLVARPAMHPGWLGEPALNEVGKPRMGMGARLGGAARSQERAPGAFRR